MIGKPSTYALQGGFFHVKSDMMRATGAESDFLSLSSGLFSSKYGASVRCISVFMRQYLIFYTRPRIEI